MNGIKLSGFKEFENKLRNLPAHLMQEVDVEVEDSAELWREGAIRDAPIDQGLLKQSISKKRDKVSEWDIISPVDYSAFVEWGTRTRVFVPAELQSYAARFRGATGQKGAREFIYEWCRRKGIEPGLWFVIYRSIMIRGIHPHPFFFIQRPIVEKFLINNIRRIINTPH